MIIHTKKTAISYLQSDNNVHGVVTRVNRKRLGNNQEGVSVGTNAKSLSASDCLWVFSQSLMASNFKSTSSGNNWTKLDWWNFPNNSPRLSSMQFLTARSPSRMASLICAIVCRLGPLMRRVTDLNDSVLRWDDKSDNSLWVDAVLDKSELVFTENSFVDESCFSKTVRSHVINRIHAMSTASKGQSLHVSSLCSSKSDNVLLKTW